MKKLILTICLLTTIPLLPEACGHHGGHNSGPNWEAWKARRGRHWRPCQPRHHPGYYPPCNRPYYPRHRPGIGIEILPGIGIFIPIN